MKTKPSKFHKFFEAMQLVLQDERTVILTDPELLTLVNQKLKRDDRISYSTFQKWVGNTSKSVDNLVSISDEDKEEFRQVLAYARVNQKMNLTGEVMNAENKNQWGSTWILERKFEDLRKQPQIQLNSNPTIQITAGDKEAQRMIDAMINGEIIDVDFEEESPRQIGE